MEETIYAMNIFRSTKDAASMEGLNLRRFQLNQDVSKNVDRIDNKLLSIWYFRKGCFSLPSQEAAKNPFL